MRVVPEMQKLRDWLDENNIDWLDDSQELMPINTTPCWMCRTHFKYKGHNVSVINGYGSYGGYDMFHDNATALEMMINEQEPIGWLSCDNIIEKLEDLDEH